MIHRKKLPDDIRTFRNASVFQADLADPRTLAAPCKDADCIVHFAGVLFAPRPKKFLPRTNLGYVQNLVAAALQAGVRKFILISFPHVEGETTPDNPATGRLDGRPNSVHARTRLAAEKHLFGTCEGTSMIPVALRAGMVYARGVLMIDAARWLMKHHLMAVWKRPTWNHLLALPDFLSCVQSAIEREAIRGVYNCVDDKPVTLQEFLDCAAAHWAFRKPRRLPRWSFYVAAWCCEAFATIFAVTSPLTRDFIRIGMASSVADNSKMKADLLPRLAFPTLEEGLPLL